MIPNAVSLQVYNYNLAHVYSFFWVIYAWGLY